MEFPLVRQTIPLGQVQIKLYFPEEKAVREAYEQGLISFPYWSRVWPAAKALARFLLQHPNYTEAKQVVELGAGLGLPSLVAARNAAAVLCTDVAPEAIAIIKQSARQQPHVTAAVLDWQQVSLPFQPDVLLLSDVNYEPSAFDFLRQSIVDFLNKGTTVILSTPQRLVAKDFIRPLLANCTKQEEMEVAQGDEMVRVTVLVLQRNKQ